MLKYIFKKIVSKIIVLFIVTIMVFVLANVSRVDPAESYVRRTSQIATTEQIEEMREALGLNDPILVQYKNWLKNVFHGDFGTSLITDNLVLDDIKVLIGPTLLLATTATIIAVVVGVLLGILCAIYKDRFFDKLIRFLTLSGISVPNFWIGFLLLYFFAIELHLVPVVSEVSLRCIILPSVAMAIMPTAQYIRLMRNSILDHMNKDYVLYSRARGLPKRIVVYRHVLKNAIQPLIPLFFQNFAYKIIGAAIIESVFTWPGMGSYMIHAVLGRDFEVVAFYVLFSAIVFSTTSITSDIVNGQLNKQLMMDRGYKG